MTPSEATGAAFEPMRSLQGFAVSGIPSGPASGMAGDRGDDLAGGTGPERRGGSGPTASSSSGLVPAQREGNQAAIPGHGTGPLLLVSPVNTGHAPPSPALARSALFSNKKIGANGPMGHTRPHSAIEQITSPATMK